MTLAKMKGPQGESVGPTGADTIRQKINLAFAKRHAAARAAAVGAFEETGVPVPATDSPRPSDGQEVVRAEDTNRNVNHKDKKNSLGRASPTGAFRLTGVGVPGVSERPEPTTTGKLMDFCRTSSQVDRQQLMSAALMKGQPAVEKMLARLKSTRAGKGMDTSQLKALVLRQLALLPDAI